MSKRSVDYTGVYPFVKIILLEFAIQIKSTTFQVHFTCENYKIIIIEYGWRTDGSMDEIRMTECSQLLKLGDGYIRIHLYLLCMCLTFSIIML